MPAQQRAGMSTDAAASQHRARIDSQEQQKRRRWPRSASVEHQCLHNLDRRRPIKPSRVTPTPAAARGRAAAQRPRIPAVQAGQACGVLPWARGQEVVGGAVPSIFSTRQSGQRLFARCRAAGPIGGDETEEKKIERQKRDRRSSGSEDARARDRRRESRASKASRASLWAGSTPQRAIVRRTGWVCRALLSRRSQPRRLTRRFLLLVPLCPRRRRPSCCSTTHPASTLDAT